MAATQSGSTASSSSKGSNQFGATKTNEVPQMMSPHNPMMGMMPGNIPNMQGQNAMGAGLGQDQQQFMPFQSFIPMMYPGAAPGSANFQQQNF